MGATSKTPFMGLPQFVEGDKPSWLTDVNDAMLKIDTCSEKTHSEMAIIENAIENKEIRFKLLGKLNKNAIELRAHANLMMVGSILIVSFQYTFYRINKQDEIIIGFINGNILNLNDGEETNGGPTIYAPYVNAYVGNGTQVAAYLVAIYDKATDRTNFKIGSTNYVNSYNTGVYGSGSIYFMRKASDNDGC